MGGQSLFGFPRIFYIEKLIEKRTDILHKQNLSLFDEECKTFNKAIWVIWDDDKIVCYKV